MALKIRLRQQGRTNRKTYRLVVIDSRTPRDGKYVENLGWYNPFCTDADASIDGERTLHWVKQGAVLSETASALVKRFAPEVTKHLHERDEAKRIKLAGKRKAAKAKPEQK